MLSNERIEQMARDHVCGGHKPRTLYEKSAVKSAVAWLRTVVAEAEAANDKAWRRRLAIAAQDKVGSIIAAAILARGEEQQ